MKNEVAVKNNKGVLNAVKIYVMLMMISLMGSVCTIHASATSGGTSDAAWNQVKEFLSTWVLRAGGAGIVIGLVFFGFGWFRDDPDARMRGIYCVIGGAIVAAVAGVISVFM